MFLRGGWEGKEGKPQNTLCLHSGVAGIKSLPYQSRIDPVVLTAIPDIPHQALESGEEGRGGVEKEITAGEFLYTIEALSSFVEIFHPLIFCT